MAVAVARGTCGPGASSLLYPAAISRWAEGPQDLTSVVLTVKDSLSRNDSFSRITRLDAAVSYRNLLIAEARGWERQQGPTAGRPGASSFQNLLGCARTRCPCPPGQAQRGCVVGTCGRACAHGRVSCRDGVTGSCLASACVDVTAARSACGSWLGLPSGHRHPAVPRPSGGGRAPWAPLCVVLRCHAASVCVLDSGERPVPPRRPLREGPGSLASRRVSSSCERAFENLS